jgi:hypothetical protein
MKMLLTFIECRLSSVAVTISGIFGREIKTGVSHQTNSREFVGEQTPPTKYT